MSPPRDREHVIREICGALAPYVRSTEIRPDGRLGDYITNSVDAAAFVLDVSKRLSLDLSPTLFWQQPTVDRLAAHLVGGQASRKERQDVRASDRAIAVVGLACRFPRCRNAAAYWQLLDEGATAIDRLSAARSELLGRTQHSDFETVGGFMSDVEWFDNGFFRISPREALCMDPQQRVLAEVTWEALENAGLTSPDLIDQNGGVFIGAMWSDYGRYFAPENMDIHSATGLDSSVLSARLSYLLGVRGPSLTVNTACSSSLVAVHLACGSVLSGESDFAIAGGVNLILAPHSTVSLARFGGLSPTGSCKTFDAAADGYVRGEGCGVVILRRLDDAIACGDNILGVIAGSATNNNGYSASLTAPSREAQEQLLANAYRNANTDPGDVSYVEVHGTGTALGDPIEAHALAAVLCAERDADKPLRVGSAKTNIGHCEAAAGIAGLIKVLLSMRHATLPAHLNFRKPNPGIPFDQLRLAVNDARTPWYSADGKLVAGVSSFGFGGSNCHVVVSNWGDGSPPPSPRVSTAELVRINRTAGGLADQAALRPRTAFVFPGQGSQWPQMGRALLTLDAEFQKILRSCDDHVRSREGWSVIRVLLDAGETIDDTTYLWPCLTAVQIGLAAAWQDRGFRPDAMVGHSIGEISAAQCAGAFSLADALDLSVAQSRWADQHQGAMALVKLDWNETESFLDETGYKRIHRAVQQDPASTVVSGSQADISRLKKTCKARAIGFVPVRVRAAMHRPMGSTARANLRDGLPSILPQAFELPFYAASTGGLVGAEELSPDYWTRNLTSPVLWMQAVSSAIADGISAFVEMAPHPIMANSLRNIASAHGKNILSVASAERDKLPSGVMNASASALAEHGVHCAPERGSSGAPRAGSTRGPHEGPRDVSHLIPVSAHSPRALEERCAALAAYLEQNSQLDLKDVAYTCAVKRSHLKYRAAIIAGSVGQLVERLKSPSVDHLQPVAESAERSGGPAPWNAASPRIDSSPEALLNVIAQFYVDGGDPQWQTLQPGICRLLELPGYPWQRRRYWPEQAKIAETGEPGEKRVSMKEPVLPAYLLTWNPLTELPSASVVSPAPKLVFAGAAVKEQLRGVAAFAQAKWVFRGSSYRQIAPDTFSIDPANPSHMQRLLQDVGDFGDVVYLWALTLGLTLADFATADDVLVNGPLHLVQSLIVREGSRSSPLWLVTAGAQAVGVPEVQGAGQATLWGLGRTVILEHPELNCRLIDVDPLGSNGEFIRDAIRSLDTTLSRGLEIDELAWRSGRAFAPVLRKSQSSERVQASPKAPGTGCAVITGGLGALGLKIAERIVGRGTRQILLIGRSAPGDAARQAIRQLEQSGADILTLQADVSDRAELDAALQRGLSQYGAINAVYHAAGTLDAAMLSSTDPQHYLRALRPKLHGGWNLHDLTKGMPIQRFVLMSSVSSILGLPRYASYAAANSFLDALACERHRLGLPATSISFGPLADVGMATRDGAPASFPGLPPVSINDALAAVEQLSEMSAPHQVVMNFDAEAWERMGLPSKVEKDRLAESAAASAAAEWNAVTGPKRSEAIRKQVLSLLAEILKQDAAEIPLDASFNSLGFDSLLSLEFRNRLQQVFDMRLPATLIWSAPTANELAEAVEERLEPGRATAEAPIAPVAEPVLLGGGPQPRPIQPAASDIDDLSEAELEALLVAEIEAVNRQNA